MSQFPSAIIHLEDADAFASIKLNHTHILLCFSADWCAPCRAMEGTLINTAFELADKAVVVKADSERCHCLAAELGIRSVPAYVAINCDVISEPVYGIQTIMNLLNMIEASV